MKFLVLAVFLIVSGVAAADPSAQQIVAASDKVRNPGQPFRLTSTLQEYVAGQPRDRVVLTVYAKEDAATRQFKNLVRYVAPPRDAGKMVLLDGTRMWFYDPASKVSIRISPQQRLIGQASNGDVLTVNLARDYKASIAGEDTVKDADRQERACWRLELSAATDDAIYSRIEYWVERSSFRPVKGKYYSDSGRLLKIAYYHAFRDELGAPRPTETIIIDAVDPNLVTTMTSSDYRFETIPEAWFQREFLPRLKAD
ncbi:MAG TPA: outer membrane lipoprotein-sorting protein [Burkholderiales bacterium]|nr:outer membrane lipoprotein-sorting protein [Burkholderiales bacterium]